MSPTIRIDDVPDALHRELQVRAERLGLPLPEYALRILHRAADRATPEEMRARLEGREPASPSESPADAVRAERSDAEDL